VVQKCFAGLLNVNADRSWEFVEQFLRSPDSQKAESAALAIGESRDDRAYPTLRAAIDDIPTSESKRILLLAMVLTRRDEAVEYLLEQVKAGSPGGAALALEALSVNSADLRVREMVLDAVESRQDRRIDDAFRRYFG
jgi:HEAT repeat protein